MPPERPPLSELNQVIANLVDDMAIIKREFADQRWQKVGENFTQVSNNFLELEKRIVAIEKKLENVIHESCPKHASD